VFIPTVASTVNTTSTTTPPTTTINTSATGGLVVTDRNNYNASLTQLSKWWGGTLAITANNFKSTSTSAQTTLNPQLQAAWVAQYTQPLLRNFQMDANRQGLQVAVLNRDISDAQLRSTLTNTLSNVREAYWNYVFSVQSVEVAQQALDLANQLVQNNQVKVQVGTMAPLDVVQAQSQAATAKQNLVVAQATMRTNELALKRLLVSGTEDPLWNAHLVATDTPVFQPQTIDTEAVLRRALAERTDLTITKKTLEQNDVTVKLLRNQLLPQADLVVNYGSTGVAGTAFACPTGQLSCTTKSIVSDTGYASALNNLFNRDVPQWSVQMNFSYPIGTSSMEAAVARARVDVQQVNAQLQQQQLQVATEVTNDVINVQSNVERVQAAISARELAQQQLKAENDKFDVGMSTPFLVIQAQEALTAAQNNELQAILNYQIALVELERVQQTTLQQLNITVIPNR